MYDRVGAYNFEWLIGEIQWTTATVNNPKSNQTDALGHTNVLCVLVINTFNRQSAFTHLLLLFFLWNYKSLWVS